jgi:hypothetical protein
MSILARYYRKDTNLVTREIAGETIIVPIKNKVGDLNSIYTLNEIGSMIWQLIDDQKSVNQIVEEVCMAYEVGREEAEKDTLEFLNTLKEAGVIHLSTDERHKGP